MINILLLVLAAVPYALGWTTGIIARVICWFGRTVKWGWQEAHGKRNVT